MRVSRITRSLVAALALCVGATSVSAAVIFDNKSSYTNPNQLGIVTHPGGGAGGFDASVLANTAVPADTIFGFGHAGGNRLAEDFTVPAGQTWTITGFRVYGYLTGATAPGWLTGTIRVLDGVPNIAVPPNVLGGDTTTNALAAGSNVFTNIYRTLTADQGTATNRRVQEALLNLPAALVLGPGTYWMEYGATGTSFVPPISALGGVGGAVTGNGVQFLTGTPGSYAAVVDGTAGKGIPFQIEGTISGGVVPEPTSLACLAIAGLGLTIRRRK